MAVTFSRALPLKIELCEQACKSCGLSIYQEPAFDRFRKAQIFWVGLSAVHFEDGQKKMPLSPTTPSGSLVHSIELPFKKQFCFYKTNLVKCAPMDNDKIRYPIAHEMEKCFGNFEWELQHLKPKTVFLLGKQVSDFLFKKLQLPKISLNDKFEYRAYEVDGIKFIPIHHPSYILVYKRKLIELYIESLHQLIKATKASIR